VTIRDCVTLASACVVTWLGLSLTMPGAGQDTAQPGAPTYAFVNGQWFNGRTFEPRTTFSVNGLLTSTRPAHIDQTLDLSNTFIVPPFADAHNHNIGTGDEARDRQAIRRYLADGIFYVKIQGNLPLPATAKVRLGLNTATGLDVVFAHGASLTGTDGHPIALFERVLLPQGQFPGHTAETLRDVRYFTVDGAEDLERKWPRILGDGPDFIKIILLFSDEYEKRRTDRAYFGQKGLDPRLVPAIVMKARSVGLRVSAHVATGDDFHAAIAAGVDEVAHLPAVSEIRADDARVAAQRGIVVVTTYAVAVPSLIRIGAVREPDVRRVEAANLKLLRSAGVRLAIGSDNPSDTSVQEAMYLAGLEAFDNLELLRLWIDTALTIFPDRKIGALDEGYEASFLALEGNPLSAFENVKRIRLRVKQGVVLEP
jgi:imidazolonepropionase-like amidohydrolase